MGGVELVVTLHGRGRACPARRFAWADVCGWLPGGWPLAQGFAGRRGRRPLRFAREWAAAGACPSSGPAGPPSPKGEGKGCSGGIHPSRGVGGRFCGASGTPRPTVCPGTGGSGSLPLIRPGWATFPQGGRQGLLLAAAGGRGGVGAPRPTDGDMETPAGFTRTPVPGPPHGRGRACPARGGYAGPRQWFGP